MDQSSSPDVVELSLIRKPIMKIRKKDRPHLKNAGRQKSGMAIIMETYITCFENVNGYGNIIVILHSKDINGSIKQLRSFVRNTQKRLH